MGKLLIYLHANAPYFIYRINHIKSNKTVLFIRFIIVILDICLIYYGFIIYTYVHYVNHLFFTYFCELYYLIAVEPIFGM